MTRPNNPIDPLLTVWGSPPETPPLAPEVWRRVAAEDCTNRTSHALFGGWRLALETVFSRPSFAAAFVAACILLGMFLAEVRVSRLHRERDTQLIQSYLRLIDPLVTARPSTPPSGDRS
jgi:hypothetical protein